MKEKQGFYFHCHSRRVAMVWNDMQWYSYSLPFLLMQWYARICFAFTYIAIPADANLLNGYALNGYALHGYVWKRYVLTGYVRTFWMDAHWMDTYWMDTYWWDTYWTDTYWWDTYWWDTCWTDMCGICVGWDTPTIFWRTLRRNVFREKHGQFFPASQANASPGDLAGTCKGGDRVRVPATFETGAHKEVINKNRDAKCSEKTRTWGNFSYN